MSLEDNEMAACRVETEARSRPIVKLHRVRWTFENISEVPDKDEIKGPEIRFMRTCMAYISLKALKNLVMIRLHNSTNQDIKVVKSRLVLSDCDGQKLDERKTQSMIVQKGSSIYLLAKSIDSLKDDTLIMDFYLKVFGCVSTKSVSFKCETESQKQLISDLKTTFNNPDGSDFMLQVGEHLIYAHKYILSCRSTYFKRMFETQMVEKEQNSVHVTDVSYKTMKKLVEFLYTGDFTMSKQDDKVEEVKELYVAADKYRVMNLRCMCAEKLISFATVDNVLGILKLSARHNDDVFKSDAMKVMSFHFDEILETNDFKLLFSSELELASEVLKFCLKT